MECDVCGKTLRIGEWPFCPHGMDYTFGEEPMEPYQDWNLTDAPGGVEITSRAQRRKIMAENNFEYRPKAKVTGSTLYFDLGRK